VVRRDARPHLHARRAVACNAPAPARQEAHERITEAPRGREVETVSTRFHRTVAAVVAVVAVVAVAALVALALVVDTAIPATARSSGPGDLARDCSATVVGQRRSGELVLSPVTCGEDRAATALATIAVHYVDFGFGGGSLAIQGGACNGGWLDLPAGWVNTISSTWSACTTTHFDLYGLGGGSETLPPGGGNLSGLHDRTNSVRYT
jgi:hypothetical protein